nr:TIGR04100 family radical SAM protein [Peptacetobacter hominis]
MTIFYPIGDGLYVNITNKCPCKCVFCIRDIKETVGENDNLWLDHDPSLDEIKEELKNFDLNEYKEVVFCGFGEPMMRLETLIKTAEYIKSIADIKTRVNTNGLGDLINNTDVADCIKDVIDSVSVSLNAPDKDSYIRISRPSFGEKSYDAILKFAKRCKDEGIETVFSVVDEITEEEIEKSRDVAESIGIKLRVRYKNS